MNSDRKDWKNSAASRNKLYYVKTDYTAFNSSLCTNRRLCSNTCDVFDEWLLRRACAKVLTTAAQNLGTAAIDSAKCNILIFIDEENY
jgi:hypothetical protein